MDDVGQTTEFGKVLLYGICGVLLVLVTLSLGKLISPFKPNKEKLSTYECGEEPNGSAWIQFNSRFYVIALVFLLFDVEMVFIFPWATIFGQRELLLTDNRWGIFSLTEMFAFIGILLIGLLYIWKKGDLEWIKPLPQQPEVNVNIPASAYDRLNQEVFIKRPFELIGELPLEKNVQTAEMVIAVIPAFKPTFKKPGGTS